MTFQTHIHGNFYGNGSAAVDDMPQTLDCKMQRILKEGDGLAEVCKSALRAVDDLIRFSWDRDHRQIEQRRLEGQLKKLTQAHGPNSLTLSETLIALADLADNNCDYDRALALCRRAFHIQRYYLGSDSIEAASTAYRLARLYQVTACYYEAGVMYQHALNVHIRVLGPRNMTVLEIFDRYARMLRRLSPKDELEYFSRAGASPIAQDCSLSR
ncbi:MAG: tetratricopeptide repeat protein [Cyanobacteria bacterium SZAS LIN-2]|nr:tetratricopeptide repeat protein [Cyanobacteria bacterium SZAS LIN-2]